MSTGRITGDAYYDKINKHWFYQISIPASLTPDGKRRREKKRGPSRGVNFATKHDALEAMDKRVREIRAGKISFSGRMTFAEYMDAWSEQQQGEISDERRAKYRYVIETYALPWLGSVKLSDLADRLKAHYRHLLREGKHQGCCYRIKKLGHRGDPALCRNGKPLSPTTVTHVHVILRSVLFHAVEQDLFAVHPMTKVKAPGLSMKTFTPWTATNAQDAIKVFSDERLGPAWVIAIMHGLRRGELAGLRWSDVDLDSRVIRVANQRTLVHTETGTTVIDKEPKQSSIRSIPMSSIVAALLAGHRKRQRTEGLRNGYGSATYVFVDERGQPYPPQSFYRQFQTACKRHGLPVVRLHDLRHTFATLLFGEKVDPKIVQGLLGHSSDRVTREIYIHYIPELGQQAIAILDQKISREKSA